MQLRDLPADARQLLATLKAPSRLIAHLVLVHDAAAEILDALQKHWSDLKSNSDAVLFGAATHDIGKVLHLNELTGPGNQHEANGPGLLQQYGVSPERSRFARTHGTWSHEPNLVFEDYLVALADHVWKGSRNGMLESKIAEQIAGLLEIETWEAFIGLDEIVAQVANRGEERLAWQLTASERNKVFTTELVG